MPKLGKVGMKCLKLLHLFTASCWIGGAMSLLVLNLHNDSALNGSVLYGINSAAAQIDFVVVVLLGAYGCLLTGLLYGLFTVWGFIRHKWVLAKWAITVLAIAFGILYLGRWEEIILESSLQLGLASLYDYQFISTRALHLAGGAAQLGMLLLALALSIFKPWGKKKPTSGDEARG